MEQRLDTGLIKGHAYGITAVEKVRIMRYRVSCTVNMAGGGGGGGDYLSFHDIRVVPFRIKVPPINPQQVLRSIPINPV